jgi:hypothetical protein
MNDIQGYYTASIHPGQINISYQPFSRRTSRPRLARDGFESQASPGPRPVQFENNSHNGEISKVALRKITRAINYLTFLVPKRRYYTTADARSGTYFLSFITLTLSSNQIHSDHEIKRSILEPFLNDCRKKFKVRNYLWRAERQENGNIHFHIIADRFIWWNDLRNSWNYFQERLGYVTRYRLAMRAFHKSGFRPRKDLQNKWPIHSQYAAWRAGVRSDWNSPNSSDVHSLKSINNVRSYLVKYITKTDQASVIAGRLWGCSYTLTNLKGSQEYADGEISSELDTLLGSQLVKTYKGDYYSVMYVTPEILATLHCIIIISSLRAYCRARFPDYDPPDLFDP